MREKTMGMTRRTWLGAAVATAMTWATGYAFAEDTIKVGILHSLSGTMAISETIFKDVMLMQIDELNAKGGLLGKKVEAVVVDPASNWPLFAEKARELLSEDKVAAVFGCWTSVSRKSVLPVFEQLNGLLFYPLEYEGEEDSYNVFYGSSVPDNKAIPAVKYLMSEEGGGGSGSCSKGPTTSIRAPATRSSAPSSNPRGSQTKTSWRRTRRSASPTSRPRSPRSRRSARRVRKQR
jgi:hypothetical protein